MTQTTPTGADRTRHDRGAYGAEPHHSPRYSTETKASFKTTELIAYVATVVAVVVTSALVKTTESHADYFRADRAMFFIVLLTLGYLGSRGLAKSGSRDNYDG